MQLGHIFLSDINRKSFWESIHTIKIWPWVTLNMLKGKVQGHSYSVWHVWVHLRPTKCMAVGAFIWDSNCTITCMYYLEYDMRCLRSLRFQSLVSQEGSDQLVKHFCIEHQQEVLCKVHMLSLSMVNQIVPVFWCLNRMFQDVPFC